MKLTSLAAVRLSSTGESWDKAEVSGRQTGAAHQNEMYTLPDSMVVLQTGVPQDDEQA